MDFKWWASAIFAGFLGSLLFFLILKICASIFPKLFERFIAYLDTKSELAEFEMLQLKGNSDIKEKYKLILGKHRFESVRSLIMSIFLVLLISLTRIVEILRDKTEFTDKPALLFIILGISGLFYFISFFHRFKAMRINMRLMSAYDDNQAK